MRPSMMPSLPCASLLSRRDVFRFGALSVGATVVPSHWARAAETSVEAAGSLRNAKADSVIFLWMGGGVTHIDSFDPKPHAPEKIRGTLGAISTSLPGVQFAQPMSRQQSTRPSESILNFACPITSAAHSLYSTTTKQSPASFDVLTFLSALCASSG